MEVCRLCLDLVATQGGAKLLDGETRDMVQVVAPELNLEASKEPHTCAECQRTLTRLFEFKSRVFEREAEVRAAVGTRRGKFGLKEALEGGDAKGTPSATTDPGGGEAPPKAKDRVCRTCLAPIECESFTVLRPSEPDAYLSSMLDVCLVEVDLELTLDPVMCEACLEQLQRLHHFRSACRDVEEKIVAFREGGGAGAGPVDLHTVLGAAAAAAPDVEMVTVKEEDEGAAGSSGAVPRRGGRKRVKVEPAKAEPVKEEEEDEEDDESEEEEDDEDEDMSDGDEDDPDGELKQEELDIKSETGTSDSDRCYEFQLEPPPAKQSKLPVSDAQTAPTSFTVHAPQPISQSTLKNIVHCIVQAPKPAAESSYGIVCVPSAVPTRRRFEYVKHELKRWIKKNKAPPPKEGGLPPPVIVIDSDSEPDPVPEDVIYRCKDCTYHTTRLVDYSLHIQRRHHPCDECSYVTVDDDELRAHRLKHASRPHVKMTCKTCGQVTTIIQKRDNAGQKTTTVAINCDLCDSFVISDGRGWHK